MQPSLRVDNPQRVSAVLLLVVAFLVLGHLIGLFFTHALGYQSVKGLVPLFDLDGEANLPASFSSKLLLVCGVVLLVIGYAERHGGVARARYWLALGVVFVLLSIDESSQGHELLGEPVRGILGVDGGVFYFAWVIPGVAFVAAMALIFARFVMGLPQPTRRLFYIAGACYVVGAIGLELVESHLFTTSQRGWLYGIAVAVEESLELLGAIVFLHALLSFAAAHHYGVHLQFHKPPLQPGVMHPGAHAGTLTATRFAPTGAQTNAMAGGRANDLPDSGNGYPRPASALLPTQPEQDASFQQTL